MCAIKDKTSLMAVAVRMKWLTGDARVLSVTFNALEYQQHSGCDERQPNNGPIHRIRKAEIYCDDRR